MAVTVKKKWSKNIENCGLCIGGKIGKIWKILVPRHLVLALGRSPCPSLAHERNLFILFLYMPGIKKKLGDKLGYGAQLVICDFCSGHLYVVVWQFGPYEKNMFLAIKTCIFNLFRTLKKRKISTISSRIRWCIQKLRKIKDARIIY